MTPEERETERLRERSGGAKLPVPPGVPSNVEESRSHREEVARWLANVGRAGEEAQAREAPRVRQEAQARAQKAAVREAARARQEAQARAQEVWDREVALERAQAKAREATRASAEALAREKAAARQAAWARQDAQARAQQARERAKADEDERARASERAKRKEALVGRLRVAFEADFPAADEALAADPSRNLLTWHEYEKLKGQFVRAWAIRELRFNLDLDQATAIATAGGAIKVVARAGSGKTRTLTTRAAFLQMHCRVSPSELLLLAFNKDAAEEMKSRLRGVLGEDLPHVMTFHALAHALVHPEEDLLFDDPVAGARSLSRDVQEVIDQRLGSPDFGDHIRDLMLAHFREDWERIVDGRLEFAMDEFLTHRRALHRESLNGEFVKSFGEREIANALFEHDVRYKYERSFLWNGVNYRPDFTISTPHGGIVIEYFGLKGDRDYDEMSAAKRAYWAARGGWTLLEYAPRDLVQNGLVAFRRRLLDEVRALGVRTRRRSEEEIWQEVRRRALDRFTSAMASFIGRCRKRNLKPDGLKALIAAHRPASRSEGLFLEVGQSVYEGYLRHLGAQNKDDFDGLMWRAVSVLFGGQTRFVRDRGREKGDLAQLRHVLIDEFQDFSGQFYELLCGIRQASPKAQLFCIGDDWQAINGFAGSDLRYFSGFAEHFGDTRERHLTTNYRSAVPIVQAGNALMHGRGDPAKPHADEEANPVLICRLDTFIPSAFEHERHKGDYLTPAVLRVVRRFLDDGVAVVLLSRTNNVRGDVRYADEGRRTADGLERFVEHIRSFLPEADRDRVTISTTHRYKGRESAAVVVLDAVVDSYPLVHPSWVFLRVFGDTVDRIEDEERRLFYVAITRAKTSLALVTETQRQSPFIADIQQHEPLQTITWSELPEAPSLLDPRLEIRVYIEAFRVDETFEVRHQLKKHNFRWNQHGEYWSQTAPEQGFSFEALRGEPWAQGRVRIVVLSASGGVVDMLHPGFDVASD